MNTITQSEALFEKWCQQQRLPFKRIRVARVENQKRPDYRVRTLYGWCVVEIKELLPTREDDLIFQSMLRGEARWVDPGTRLRRPIRDAAKQLRKFSKRSLPTVLALVDLTASFHTEKYQVLAAMNGHTKLVFELNQPIAKAFLGAKPGGGATLTSEHNTSISAIAAVRHEGIEVVAVDLYHNPHARIPLPKDWAQPFVRRQFFVESSNREPTVLDLMHSDEWQEWLDDPIGKRERTIKQVLAEMRGDPFDTFTEWSSDFDQNAYRDL